MASETEGYGKTYEPEPQLNTSTMLCPCHSPANKELLRILISTDNHVGFNEKHPVRGMDSFLAFEEVRSSALLGPNALRALR